MKYLYVVLASVAICLSGCKPSVDFTEEIRATDSLKNELQSAAKEYTKIDSGRVSEVRKSIDAYLGFVTENLKDTIERTDAILLSNFKSVNKSLGKYVRTSKELHKNYKHNLKQLEDLAYDLRNKNIENKDSAGKYVVSEREANAQLISAMKIHSYAVPVELRKYDSLKIHVDTLIKKINKGTIPPDLLRQGENK